MSLKTYKAQVRKKEGKRMSLITLMWFAVSINLSFLQSSIISGQNYEFILVTQYTVKKLQGKVISCTKHSLYQNDKKNNKAERNVTIDCDCVVDAVPLCTVINMSSHEMKRDSHSTFGSVHRIIANYIQPVSQSRICCFL